MSTVNSGRLSLLHLRDAHPQLSRRQAKRSRLVAVSTEYLTWLQLRVPIHGSAFPRLPGKEIGTYPSQLSMTMLNLIDLSRSLRLRTLKSPSPGGSKNPILSPEKTSTRNHLAHLHLPLALLLPRLPSLPILYMPPPLNHPQLRRAERWQRNQPLHPRIRLVPSKGCIAFST
ncbi:hypothetical protein EDB83DRAFT_2411623 [Lactarius deliciosus]|nr:hypothetical protein EDB83DRAFT_2411623 [Lactarius deliciosus]